jgi:catechol 2,3-dioxygenase-like lactoylglutathione lyase family enzyme
MSPGLLGIQEEQMISGGHVVVYSKDVEADRAFFRDLLGFKSVDAGHGWLIFALPPTEVALHPSEEGGHELYFMCEDLKAEMASLAGKGVKCSIIKVEEARWGFITKMLLLGGGKVGLYQPKHPTALV